MAHTAPPAVVASLLDALDRVAFRSCHSADRAYCTMLARDLTEAAELAAFVVSAPAIGSDDRALAQRTIRLAARAQPGAAAGTNVRDAADWCHVPALAAFDVLPHTYLPAELRRALTADKDAATATETETPAYSVEEARGPAGQPIWVLKARAGHTCGTFADEAEARATLARWLSPATNPAQVAALDLAATVASLPSMDEGIARLSLCDKAAQIIAPRDALTGPARAFILDLLHYGREATRPDDASDLIARADAWYSAWFSAHAAIAQDPDRALAYQGDRPAPLGCAACFAVRDDLVAVDHPTGATIALCPSCVDLARDARATNPHTPVWVLAMIDKTRDKLPRVRPCVACGAFLPVRPVRQREQCAACNDRDLAAWQAPAADPVGDTCDLCGGPIGEDFRQLGQYGIVCYGCHAKRQPAGETDPPAATEDSADAEPAEPVSLTGRDVAALETVATIAELPASIDEPGEHLPEAIRAFLPEVATATIGDHPALIVAIRRAQSAYSAMFRADTYTAAAMWDAAQTAARAALETLQDAAGPWGEPITLDFAADPELVSAAQCDHLGTCDDCRASLDQPHYDGCHYRPAVADPAGDESTEDRADRVADLQRQRADDRAVLARLAARLEDTADRYAYHDSAATVYAVADAIRIVCDLPVIRHNDRAAAEALIAGL